MSPEPAPTLDITDVVDRIGSMVERVLTEANEAEILGPALHRLRSERELPRRVVIIGVLLNDFARVAYSCSQADGRITDEEVEQIYPIFYPFSTFLAKARPEYRAFARVDQDELRALLREYAADTAPFGALAEDTRWIGLDVCRRTARATGDEEPLELYIRAQQRTMDRVVDVGGGTPEEAAARARLDAIMDLRRRLFETPLHRGTDPRLAAFCDREGPHVFGAIAHAHQVWERDPFDVDSVHAEAREAFERLVRRVTSPDADERGRILVMRGQSGAGKTHLMRAFRGHLHGRRMGFAAYMQMTTRTDDYARYVLVNLIDALERPYDPPEVTASGLITLSDALVEDRSIFSADALEQLRTGDFDLQHDDQVSPLVDELLGRPAFHDFDPDLLRVFLFLQRRDHRIRARVLKYLRCEELNDYDRRMLGGIAARVGAEAPLRMVEQLGRLMARIGRFSLVLLVDQLEDVLSNQQEVGHLVARSIDVLRRVVDHVPTAIVVLSCLQDLYPRIREHLTQSAIDRLESDPPPLTLNAGRSLADIQQIVGLRLEYLYDKIGVRWHEDDPTFPIGTKALESLVNLRTRDVLKWCREHQELCIEAGGLADPHASAPAPGPSEPTAVTELEQRWNDFRTSFSEAVPEDDEALLELLGAAAARVGQELEPAFALLTAREGNTLVIREGDRPLVVGICNRDPRGGGLHNQLEALHAAAGGRPLAIVRCAEYPDNPRTRVVQRLGQLLAAGGRRVTVEDSDWRTMMAFRAFAARHGDDPSFARWRQDERPLSQLTSLRSLLALDEPRTRGAKVSAPEPEAASATAPVAAVPVAAVPVTTVPTTTVPTTTAPTTTVPTTTVPTTTVPTTTAPITTAPITTAPITTAPITAVPPSFPSSAIVLGRSAGLAAEPVTLELDSMVTHAAFLGSTGSGKTTLALNLIEQALERGIPALMLDRKGDLATYARPGWWQTPGRDLEATARKRALAERVEVAVFTPGAPDGRDLALTVIPEGLAEMSGQERAQSCRQAAAAIGTMLGYKGSGSDLARQSVLAKALEVLGQVATEDVGLERVISLIADEDPTLVNAVGRLDTRHFGKLVDHLETLRLTKGELLSGRAERLDPARLLGLARDPRGDGKVQLGVISTKFLGDNASIDFWVARMLSELARWANRNPSPHLQALVLFDEADLYMPALRKPATKEPMQDLLRRARSAGLGVMLATQSPGDLDYKSRDNIRTWFLGRVAESTAVAKMQPLLSESRVNVKGKLARQSIGEFFRLEGGKVTEMKADRSLMDTEQLAEDEIRQLARRAVA